jgi:Fe-S-cluster containining protein
MGAVLPVINQPPLQFSAGPFVVINRAVYFNGNCDECRPHCGAVCCAAYGFVGLTKEEAGTGLYAYKEVSENCDCATCQRMRELDLQYTVLKHPDGSCIYLDGARGCSIYQNRPETCKKYTCKNIPFMLTPAS